MSFPFFIVRFASSSHGYLLSDSFNLSLSLLIKIVIDPRFSCCLPVDYGKHHKPDVYGCGTRDARGTQSRIWYNLIANTLAFLPSDSPFCCAINTGALVFVEFRGTRSWLQDTEQRLLHIEKNGLDAVAWYRLGLINYRGPHQNYFSLNATRSSLNFPEEARTR